MKPEVFIFLDVDGASVYYQGRLVDHDIMVKSAWLFKVLYRLQLIPYQQDYYVKLVAKYGDFGKVPTIDSFLLNDYRQDPEFHLEVDLKFVQVHRSKKSPLLFSTLQRFLAKNQLSFQ